MYPGIDFPFNYYSVCPNRKPLPPHQTARVDEVLNMTAGPYYFETMRLPGEKKAKILAERVVNGPAELFLQAEQQRIPLAVPVPGAGAMLHTAIPYTNSHFFLRVNGKLKEVRRDIFERQISTYLEACPELAQKIARGDKGYHYRNLISIVTEYNAYLQAQSASPGN
ncbi:hypothetical protein [Hymenobacter sp. B81]|uniref:hypothetical protein n=1 Tax=Hymenobacter sp. B81 TaxID=3344878 RepID=UPI0037DC0A1D